MSKANITCINSVFTLYLFFIFIFVFCFVLLVRIKIIRDFFAFERYLTRRKYSSAIVRALGYGVRIESSEPHKFEMFRCLFLYFFKFFISTMFLTFCRRAQRKTNHKSLFTSSNNIINPNSSK